MSDKLREILEDPETSDQLEKILFELEDKPKCSFFSSTAASNSRITVGSHTYDVSFANNDPEIKK